MSEDIAIFKNHSVLNDVDDNALLFAVTPDCEIIVGTKKDFESIDWDKENNLNYCTDEFYNTLAAVILKSMYSEKSHYLTMKLPVDEDLSISLTAELVKPDVMGQLDDGSYIQ